MCSNIAVNVTFRDLNICNILEWLRAARAATPVAIGSPAPAGGIEASIVTTDELARSSLDRRTGRILHHHAISRS